MKGSRTQQERVERARPDAEVALGMLSTAGSSRRTGRNGGPEVDVGDQRRWFFGPIGYVLRDIRVLKAPVPCRGNRGFWTLPPHIEVAVRCQLEAA